MSSELDMDRLAVLVHEVRSPVAALSAIAETVLEAENLAPGSRLNLMLTDGRTLVATAWTHSLSTLVTPEAVMIASEPWDTDPRWTAVADRHIVVARANPGPPSLAVRALLEEEPDD